MSKQNNSRGGESVAPFDMKGRIPPQALEMEQAVLGALLLERGAMDKIEGVLKPETFYKEGNRCVYEAMLELSLQKEPIDLLTVKNHLSQSGKLDAAGGFYYLVELTSKVASAANIEYHARIIAQKYKLRELIKIGDSIVQAGYNETTNVFDLIDKVKDDIELLDGSSTGSGGMDFAEAVNLAEVELQKVDKGEQVFFPPLRFMPGYSFMAGEYVTVGADSGVGKTAIAMQWGFEVSNAGWPVIFNALEMSPVQLAMREMAMSAGINGFRMRQGKLTKEQWMSWKHLLGVKNFHVVSCRTPAKLNAARKAYLKEIGWTGPCMVINDYLQLMTGTGRSEEEKIGNNSGQMQEDAATENFLLVQLVQLNRKWLESKERRPGVHNIHSCDQVRHDSDYVFILHIPERYTDKTTDEDGNSILGMGKVIIGKSRIGFLDGKFEVDTHIVNGKWLSESDFYNQATMPRADSFPDPKRFNRRNDDAQEYDLKDFL